MPEQKSLTLEEKLAKLDEECPLIPFVRASQLFSTVRRMKAEKELDIPLKWRSGFAISARSGKAANAMTDAEWEEFFRAMRAELQRCYPDLYERVFPKGE